MLNKMGKPVVQFYGVEYDCIRLENEIFLLNVKSRIPNSGWCLYINDMIHLNCYLKASSRNFDLSNYDCKIYDILFLFPKFDDFDEYVISFVGTIFSSIIRRFSFSKKIQLKIGEINCLVEFKMEENGVPPLFNVYVKQLTNDSFLKIYNFAICLIKFLSIGSSHHVEEIYINGDKILFYGPKNVKNEKDNYLNISFLSDNDLYNLLDYVGKNYTLLENLYIGEDRISTKDIGALYALLECALDNEASNKGSKLYIKKQQKREICKHKELMDLIDNFKNENELQNLKDFDDLYNGVKNFDLSIQEKIGLVFNDFNEDFKDTSLSLDNEQIDDFKESIKKLRSFDSHKTNLKANKLVRLLSYGPFFQILVLYSVLKYGMKIDIKLVIKIFETNFYFGFVCDLLWIKDKIK